MWPFSCHHCCEKENIIERLRIELGSKWRENISLLHMSKLKWSPLSDSPPLNTNLLVANKDFTYFGFLYMDDGWDNSRRINMQCKDKVWPTYTNTESIAWWLNLDKIKK